MRMFRLRVDATPAAKKHYAACEMIRRMRKPGWRLQE
jgi:hypothetical protein